MNDGDLVALIICPGTAHILLGLKRVGARAILGRGARVDS